MDKKITDLQLRSNVNEDVNFAADDGIQTYRVTAPQVEAFVYGKNQRPDDIQNYSLACSVGSSALTIALKTAAGGNPTAATPVRAAFKNSTAATGVAQIGLATAATSLVISSGSKVGTGDGLDKYLYVYLLNNAGTLELAVSGKQWDQGSRQSTTAEGGAGAADAGDVLYSTTTRSNLGIRLIARLKVNQTTAGTWAALPTEISLPPFSPARPVWSGYHEQNPIATNQCWTTSSTSYANFANNSGDLGFIEKFNEGFMTVAPQGGTGSSSLPGVVFTPPEDGLYYIEAGIAIDNTSAATEKSVRLYDTTNSVMIDGSPESYQTASQGLEPCKLSGIFRGYGGVAQTLALQGKVDGSGTLAISGGYMSGRAIEWSIFKL
jgi:hypothetical protein